MSIYIGTNKITKIPVGTTPLLFATEGNSRLIYPNLLFRSNPGIVTTYQNWGANQQIALQPTYSVALYDLDGLASNTYQFTGNGWRQFTNSGNIPIYGSIRYHTELRFTRPNLGVYLKIGYALMGTNTSTYIDGIEQYVDNTWHTYDATFFAVLYPGAAYAVIINGGTSYVEERNAVATFIAD